MIINRNMDKYMLQIKTKAQDSYGQWKETWVDVKEIDVAIYPASYTILTSANIKYSESTNTGLSTYKDIKEVVNRIIKGNKIYEVTFSNSIGKFTQLYLKKVIFNG